jgi:hypothetical protein
MAFRVRHTRLALWAALITWLPLPILVVLETGSLGGLSARSFLMAIGPHARYLLCVPLLIMADMVVPPRLWRILEHFGSSGIVADRAALAQVTASAHRWFDSTAALVVIVVLAYIASAFIIVSFQSQWLPEWHRGHGLSGRFSLSGWWHAFVSIPLLVALIFWWVWRLFVWARVLRDVARCELQLIVSHPDRSAGLGFLGGSLRAFTIVGVAFSTIVASRLAQQLLAGVTPPRSQIAFDIGVVLFIVLLLVAPLFVFTRTLMRVGRIGGLEYSALAQRMGRRLESRWLRNDEASDNEGMLTVQDFSATTDLYSIVAGSRGIRWIPVGERELIRLALALLLPFIPVVLLIVPLSVILGELKGLLL